MTAPTYEPLTEKELAELRKFAFDDRTMTVNTLVVRRTLATIDAERAERIENLALAVDGCESWASTLADLKAERAAREAAEAKVETMRVVCQAAYDAAYDTLERMVDGVAYDDPQENDDLVHQRKSIRRCMRQLDDWLGPILNDDAALVDEVSP